MDRGNRVLTKGRSPWSACILFTAAAAVIFCAVPGVEAFQIYSTEVKQRLAAYGVQIGTEEAIRLQVNKRTGLLIKKDTLEGEMAKWKHQAYADDHRTADAGRKNHAEPYIRGVEDYVGKFKGAGNYGAVFTGPGAVTATGPLHSEVYRTRMEEWRKRLRKLVLDNNMVLDELRDRQPDIKKALDYARGGDTKSLTGGFQAAAFMDALAGAEMMKLQADLGRRLSLETEIEMNEQQERSDELAAFQVAVGTWTAPAVSGGAY